ncbi:DHA2 family lincomycin resistance protein-like MFS transporter [Murinocardiopsis flavida]|uniref:DHA2 family lincomycin resistance protein-like MFS transporter n=1 Tax=Murinocardiopsis flavida TaxID=645275 RepID=A0A2P8DDS8_9ACTN|nr:MFS transporter [Murinocardiopsis flavida]PSK95378.1 DHA2 family lincomycin resistance protein-like MFS transporter [Murinocardiopsis flavida]
MNLQFRRHRHASTSAIADRPATRWLVLAFLSLLQLLIAVDVTVVNVALPSIGTAFGADAGALTWVVTGYTVVGGGLLLLGGRLCDLLGRRRMFLLGAAVFGGASLLAGLATDLPTLVAARFAQGAGEALASPAAMSLIALMFPRPDERAKALGVWGAISSSGLAVGVVLSGVITELLDWRWIFLINPPLVLLVLVATPLLLPRDTAAARVPLDVPGALLLTLAPLALVFGVVRAAHAPWGDPTVFGPLLFAAAAFAAFVAVEARSAAPLVPLGFFAHRTRLVANAATILLSAALSTTFFLVSLYLQQVIDLTPLRAGLAFLPFCAALLLAVTQVARLIRLLGMKHTAIAGLLCTAAGLAWLARLPADGDLWIDVIPAMIAIAVGMAVGLIALQNAALEGVTDTDAGTAAGVQRSVDQLGGAVGLSVLVGAAVAAGDAAQGFRLAFALALGGVLVAALGVALAARSEPRER